MPRYKLRTLLIVLALGPPVLWIWSRAYSMSTDGWQPILVLNRSTLPALIRFDGWALLLFVRSAQFRHCCSMPFCGDANTLLRGTAKGVEVTTFFKRNPNVPFYNPRFAVADGGGGAVDWLVAKPPNRCASASTRRREDATKQSPTLSERLPGPTLSRVCSSWKQKQGPRFRRRTNC